MTLIPHLMRSFSASDNPLRSNSIQVWHELIDAVDPASMLVLIEQKLGPKLKTQFAAEDILQEALLHAWRDRHQCSWSGLRSFRAWLISIIDHRIHDAADYLSAQKRSGDLSPSPLRHADGEDSFARQVMQTTTPSRVAMYKEQAAVMQSALAGLPPELMDVVRLRLFEQLPLESIATHLGIGVAAVRHRFRKGALLYQQLLNTAFVNRSDASSRKTAPPQDDNSSSP